MGQNRLAQNRMLQRFCAEAGIPFVDTTDALVAQITQDIERTREIAARPVEGAPA